MRSERHHHLHHIFLAPLARRYLHVCAWLVVLSHFLAVEFDREALSCPIRHTQFHRQSALAFEHTQGALLCRPLTLLLQSDSLFCPFCRGRHIERHPDGVVADEIGGLLILHMILGSSTPTASGLWCVVAPGFGGVQSHCILIDGGITMRVERPDNLVVEQALVVVHIGGVVWLVAVQVLGEFGQVVGTTSFVDGGFGIEIAASVSSDVGTHGEHLRVGLTEHLTIAHSTHRITVASLDEIPEVQGEVVVIRILVASVTAECTRHHGYMLIGMACAYGINVARQGSEKCRAVEAVGRFEQACLFL